MSAFDWLRMNNKYGFQLANRFARTEFFNLFVTKDNGVRTDEFAAIVILLPSKPPGVRKQFTQIHFYLANQFSLSTTFLFSYRCNSFFTLFYLFSMYLRMIITLGYVSFISRLSFTLFDIVLSHQGCISYRNQSLDLH